MKEIETQDELDYLISTKPTVVDFYAPWCGPCRAQMPIFERLEEANPDLWVVKCNVDKSKRLAGKMKVSALPTIKLFSKGGHKTETLTGLKSQEQLQAAVDRIND